VEYHYLFGWPKETSFPPSAPIATHTYIKSAASCRRRLCLLIDPVVDDVTASNFRYLLIFSTSFLHPILTMLPSPLDGGKQEETTCKGLWRNTEPLRREAVAHWIRWWRRHNRCLWNSTSLPIYKSVKLWGMEQCLAGLPDKILERNKVSSEDAVN
jgi:hypothetical protein